MISIKKVQELAQTYFNLNVQVKQLVGYEDLNFHLKTTDGQSFILKIAFAEQKVAVLDFQNKVMQHLQKATLSVQTPTVVPNKNGEDISVITVDSQQRLMRLLTWIPGDLWGHTHPHSLELFEHLGAVCGELSLALQDFSHPAALWESKWDNAQAMWLEKGIANIPEEKKRTIAQHFFDLYRQKVVPNFSALRQSVIHNDINDYNTLVGKQDKIVGVFDFGDMIYSHTINELAVSAAYAAQKEEDPLSVITAIVKGFYQQYPLTSTEIAVLFPLIATRLCISVTFSAINRVAQPENTYIQISEKPGWDLLEKLYRMSPDKVATAFQQVCDG